MFHLYITLVTYCNLDCTDSSLGSAKNKVIVYSMALLSGCCVHKWGHKLQSIQGLKKLICFFLCGIINSYSREEASTSETPEVADACGSTASSGSTAAT